jgi:Glycosyl hydrolase catalytic core
MIKGIKSNIGTACVFALVLALCAAAACAQSCTATSRKGVAAWTVAGSNPNSIDELNIHWWYDWSPNQSKYGTGYTGGATYVPEFWDDTSTYLLPLSGVSAAASSPWVFTFNEPDVSSQSDMTVSQALSAWYTVEADSDSKLIGAPDVAGTSDGWLSSFMSSASSDGYTVKFLALHEYPNGYGTSLSTQVSTFEDYITGVHNDYPNYPIVVNEFSLVNTNTYDGTGITPAEQVAFIDQVVPWMESQSYIIGYSWFAAYLGGYGSDLLNSDGSLSTIGTAYSTVGCVGSATVPSSPTTSAATSITDSGFTANWAASSGANQYILYLYNTSWAEVGAYYVGNVTSQTVASLSASTEYEYCVVAGNAAGFSSCGNSTEATTSSSGGSIPSAPTTDAATSITSSGFTANWSASSGATEYIVYEYNSSWGFLAAYSLGNVTSYALTGQSPSTLYYYCVTAGNSAGYSSCANSVGATTASSSGNLLTNPTWANGSLTPGWGVWVTTGYSSDVFVQGGGMMGSMELAMGSGNNGSGAMNVDAYQNVSTSGDSGHQFTASVYTINSSSTNGAYLTVLDGCGGGSLGSVTIPAGVSSWTPYSFTGTVPSDGQLCFAIYSGNQSANYWSGWDSASLTVN